MPLMTYLISGLEDTSIAAREASADMSNAQTVKETGQAEQLTLDRVSPYSKQRSKSVPFKVETPTNRSAVEPRQSKPGLHLQVSGPPIPRPRTIFFKENLESTLLSEEPVRPPRAIDKVARPTAPPVPLPRSVNHTVLTTRSHTKIYRVRSVRMSEASIPARNHLSTFYPPQRLDINLQFAPHPIIRPTPQRFDPYELYSGYTDDGHGGLIWESWL